MERPSPPGPRTTREPDGEPNATAPGPPSTSDSTSKLPAQSEHSDQGSHSTSNEPIEEPVNPEDWVDRHGDVLYRWALIRVREPDLAADLVQETFLAALRGQHRFQGRSAERTWLFGILKHKMADHLRRSRWESADGSEPTAEPSPELFDRHGFWSGKVRAWSRVDGDLERQEFWEVFSQCLEHLPDHLSETFLLRELEGVDGPEVCRRLAISSASFWKRMHRARLLLRDCLQRRWFGREGR